MSKHELQQKIGEYLADLMCTCSISEDLVVTFAIRNDRSLK